MRQIKFCPNCGSPVEKSNLYCIRCGIKFDIFISQMPEQSLQPADYLHPTQPPTETRNQPAIDNQKTWASESQNWQQPSNNLQHDTGTTPKKGGMSPNHTQTPIRTQIDKFLDGLFK